MTVREVASTLQLFGGRRLAVIALAAAAMTLTLLAVKFREERRWEAELAAIEASDEGDNGLEEQLAASEPETWVRRYEPRASAGGYSLVLFERRLPMLIDMNGRVVHSWPTVRAVGRARLDRRGRLVVIGTDNLIKEYDWQSRLIWFYRLAEVEDFPHHDLIRLKNGNVLFPVRDSDDHTDYLLEVDRRRRVVWRWSAADHRGDFAGWSSNPESPTHINSVHELPPNRWFDGGDRRFRPGNILVSARHLNTIFIIDKRSGEVAWQYSDGLDYQHEASMVAEGELGAGLLLVFNNGRFNRNGYRRSLVQAIDPVARQVVWEYGAPNFFSSVGGTVQKLPGRNLAITSSHGGRVFETTPEGDTVWEWTPPYMPMRVERLAHDHCPQLASISPQTERSVAPGANAGPFVDFDLYTFALPDDYRMREVSGVERRLLEDPNQCQDLYLPPGPMLWAEWGLDESRLRPGNIRARFRLTVAARGGEERTLLESELTGESSPLWRGQNLSLRGLGRRWVTVCVSAEAEGDMMEPMAAVVWANPLISSRAQRESGMIGGDSDRSQREQKLRQQQLKALGYVN